MYGEDPVIDRHLDWCRMRNLRQATIFHRRRLLRTLVGDLGCPLLQMTGEQLLGWQQQRQHLAPQSTVTYRNHVHAFMLWAVEEGLRPDNPAERMVRPKIPRRLPNPIDEDDLEMAIICAIPDRLRLMVLLAGYCGLRVSEIAGLHREHIRETARTPHLLVFDGKGAKQRTVPLAGKVLAELSQYGWLARGAGPLFYKSGSNEPLSAAMVGSLVSGHLGRLGIPHSAHHLRHRFGTQLYAKTHDLRLVQDLMGHSDPKTTAGYVSVAADAGAQAVQLL